LTKNLGRGWHRIGLTKSYTATSQCRLEKDTRPPTYYAVRDTAAQNPEIARKFRDRTLKINLTFSRSCSVLITTPGPHRCPANSPLLLNTLP